MSASSLGALSRFEPYGGAWKLKIARCGSGDLGDQPIDPLAELGLGQLAEGVPRRRVGPAGRDEREAVERDRVRLAELEVLGAAR